MSGIKEAAFVFLVIATCGNDERVRSLAWVITIVCAVVSMTAWLVGMAFGIEVDV